MVRDETQLSWGAFFYLPLLPQNSITDLATKRQSLGFTDAETCPLGLCLINQIDLEAGVFAFPAPERDNPKMRSPKSAIKLVEIAVKSGQLIRPNRCETCDTEPVEGYKKYATVGHHWNGYDDPLNVWWVCHSCNRFLAHKHDGSLTKEEARIYVRQRQRAKLWKYRIVEVS